MTAFPGKAIALTRGEQLKTEWRHIRRAWLNALARTDNHEDHYPLLSNEDRRYVQWARLAR